MEDVAAYLQVSERTVYDWVLKGRIPAGKIGGTWRFRRSEVEEWLEQSFREGKQKKSERVSLTDVLSPERILLMESPTKLEMINQLIECLSGTREIKDPTAFKNAILKRESLMSTGIGLGIGIPHVRLDSVENHVMAAGVSKTAIRDYNSIDDGPVQIICMVAARTDQHAEYIQILAAISSRLKEKTVRDAIIDSNDEDTMYSILTGLEDMPESKGAKDA